MSGGTGQAMPTTFAQPGQPGGNKGTGQPTQTAMGTPIVYGKTYLDNSQYTKNIQPVSSPLSAPLNSSSYGGDSGYGGDSSFGGYGSGFAAANPSDFGGSSSVGTNSDGSSGPGDSTGQSSGGGHGVDGMDGDGSSGGGGGAGGK
jgi:hypothetical protein